jgi:hypothetical protein
VLAPHMCVSTISLQRSAQLSMIGDDFSVVSSFSFFSPHVYI